MQIKHLLTYIDFCTDDIYDTSQNDDKIKSIPIILEIILQNKKLQLSNSKLNI